MLRSSVTLQRVCQVVGASIHFSAQTPVRSTRGVSRGAVDEIGEIDGKALCRKRDCTIGGSQARVKKVGRSAGRLVDLEKGESIRLRHADEL